MNDEHDRGADESVRSEPSSVPFPPADAEQKIYEILKTSPAILFTQDTSLRYTWFFDPRDPGPKIAGSFIGKSDADLYTPQNAQKLTEIKKRVLQTGRGCRQEMTHAGEEGERHFELTLEPLHDESGNVSGISGMAMDITDRRLADREIRLLAQTVASTRDSVALIDKQGRILFVNDSIQILLGCDQHELIGQDISSIGAPLPGTPMREQIVRDAVDESWHGEWTARKKGGPESPLDVWLSPLRNEEGEPTAFVAVARDLTERKRAERIQTATYRIAAAVSTTDNLYELYRAIHEIVGELMPAQNFYIAVIDDQTGLLSFPYFVDELDRAPAPRAAGKGLTEYVIRTGEPLLASPEVFREMVEGGLVEALGAPSLDWLGVPLSTSGQTRGALVVQSYSEGVRFRREHYDILAFVSTQIAMAIERKRSEEAVRESEALLQTVFESLPFELWVCDNDGRYVMQNPTSVARWGYQIGKRPSETGLDPSVVQQWEENNRRAYGGEIVTGETQYNEGERTVHVYNIIAPIRQDGAVRGIMGMNMDITDRKNLEQQLLQSQKLESLGTLAGGIAHDFNNILGIIMGHASLLGELAANPARLSRSAGAIEKAANRGAALVRQILTFARKANVVFEPVNINEIASELGRMIEETFPRTIAITLNLAPDLPPVDGDRTQLHQTLLNLCVNARDAMPSGGSLSITTERIRDKGGPQGWFARLTVSDTGSGMDEATKRRIFEPFFTTKEPGRGTGLGLSVVYGIVQSHRGAITVDSTPGKGTKFRLDFPIPPSAVIQDAEMRKAELSRTRGTETLLVVEDEEMLSELLKASLEALGYTVITASSGGQALSIYESLGEHIALVISDLGLPGMSGRDLFLKIRGISPSARVVIATGYLDPGTRTELLALGACGFIQKPYLPDDVARAIREALKGAKEKQE
ncbi:MAG TPA: PAS domain S-box protein [Bacteroidota bacterium]|nr:PAS domain S-box protein [Bacteroidota bacterium]